MSYKIVDPDDLVRATALVNIGTNGTADGNIFIDTTGLLIHVAEDGVNFGPEGVTVQAIYSYLKEEWNTDSTLIKFNFPMISITADSFELQNGWDFGDQTTIDLMRDGGWAVKDAGVSTIEYANITTLGTFDDDGVDQAYYTQVLDGATTDIVLTGPVNQAVKIYGDASNGDVDYRDYFKIFLREEAKQYDEYDLLAEQSLSALTYKKYAMPLSNSVDLKVTESDATVSGYGITIEWLGSPQQVDFGSGLKDFSIVVDGQGLVSEQIYMGVQRLLRQIANIDEGIILERIGEVTGSLMEFVGDTLKTKTISSGGVYINNFHADDTNTITYSDDSGVVHEYAFVSTGTINFNDNLQADSDPKYWMFFTNTPTADFGDATAVLVDDSVGSPINGSIAGSSVGFTFAYDTNTQGGRTGATDANVTVVANGADKAQYVKLEGTILRTTGNNFTMVAPLERNYSNPA